MRATTIALLLVSSAAFADANPRREDRGDLIVLHLAGSYEEMGRQWPKQAAAPLFLERVADGLVGTRPRSLRQNGSLTDQTVLVILFGNG